MSVRVSERAFEDAIEAALLEHGPDAVPDATGKVGEEPPPYHDPGMRPGGYHKRRPEDYDRTLCASSRPTSWTSFSRRSRSSGGGSRNITARRSGSDS